MDWAAVFENTLKAFIGINAVYFAIAAIGLNVQFGYTGLLNFGQSGFLAVAAYGMAVTVQTFDLSLWLGIGIGLAAAVLLALLKLANLGVYLSKYSFSGDTSLEAS